MSIKLGSTLLAGVATNTVSNANYLLDFKWSDHIINSMEWLRADTFSWQDGTVYTGAYNHILADYNGGTSTTETVGSYTITYKLASDGHKITTDETTVANIYNESGVSWYYILDTTNQRFKLPRENPAREELIQVIRAKGNGIALGFDTGVVGYEHMGLRIGDGYQSSALVAMTGNYGATVGAVSSGSGIATGRVGGITTDSTKSGIISSMTDSTSVYKGKKYLYFYVGQFSQSATEQTAGLNAELFNGKADMDLQNVTSNLDFVVESYNNGTEWYRLYKSGWIEQGGVSTYTSNANYTVNLLKTMSNTNYTILVTISPLGSPYTGQVGVDRLAAFNLTTSSFDLKGDNSTTMSRHSWYVCGY